MTRNAYRAIGVAMLAVPTAALFYAVPELGWPVAAIVGIVAAFLWLTASVIIIVFGEPPW